MEQNETPKTGYSKTTRRLTWALVVAFLIAALITAYFTFIAVRDFVLSWEMTSIPNFADLDKEVQMQVLQTSIEQWKADRLGYSDPQAWENMQEVLLEMGRIAEKTDLNKAYTNEFVS